METLLSGRKLYGAFSFPFKCACWLNNMGTVILCFMLPTFIVALAFLPILHPVPQIVTNFLPSPLALSFPYTVTAFQFFCSFLPHFQLEGVIDPHSVTPQTNLKRCSCSTTVLSPEPAWDRLWEAISLVLCPWRTSLLCWAISLQAKQKRILWSAKSHSSPRVKPGRWDTSQ